MAYGQVHFACMLSYIFLLCVNQQVIAVKLIGESKRELYIYIYNKEKISLILEYLVTTLCFFESLDFPWNLKVVNCNEQKKKKKVVNCCYYQLLPSSFFSFFSQRKRDEGGNSWHIDTCKYTWSKFSMY